MSPRDVNPGINLRALRGTWIELMYRAWRSGIGAKARYTKLIREGDGVFTRSAGGERVVETGKYWLEVSPPAYGFSELTSRVSMPRSSV